MGFLKERMLCAPGATTPKNPCRPSTSSPVVRSSPQPLEKSLCFHFPGGTNRTWNSKPFQGLTGLAWHRCPEISSDASSTSAHAKQRSSSGVKNVYVFWLRFLKRCTARHYFRYGVAIPYVHHYTAAMHVNLVEYLRQATALAPSCSNVPGGRRSSPRSGWPRSRRVRAHCRHATCDPSRQRGNRG